jgi:threonine synthase
VRFVSTRTKDISAGFSEAILQGLAPDGGLFHPAVQPDLAGVFADLNKGISFSEAAATTAAALLDDELGAGAGARIVERAFDFSPRLRELREGLYLLELFHGPTCAFKDFGASFLAAAMEEVLAAAERSATVLVATSGDTGSAVARAFHGCSHIRVVILYPSGRVSPLQEKQLTTLGGNVTALEIQGSFDECQRLVKQAFVDEELRSRLSLTSANSINLGRLLPQAFYYVFAWSALPAGARRQLYFCVPSGNFGNLTAGVYAWQWGLPVAGFIAATNRNDVVPRYLESGSFTPGPSLETLSNAMDVGNPSNFERLQAVFGKDPAAMRAMIRGGRASDEQTRDEIARVYAEHGLLIDPHTAVGLCVERRLRPQLASSPGSPAPTVIVLATAHPGKFEEIVSRAAGAPVELPAALRALRTKRKAAVLLDGSYAALRNFLLSF